MSTTTDIDIDSLPPNEQKEFNTLLEDSRFFSLPQELKTDTLGADRFGYEVTIGDGNRQHTVKLDEAKMPESLMPLLQRLNELARAARRQRK